MARAQHSVIAWTSALCLPNGQHVARLFLRSGVFVVFVATDAVDAQQVRGLTMVALHVEITQEPLLALTA